MPDSRNYYDAYQIRETDKARLLELQATGEQLWVPKSVTEDIVLYPIPEDKGTLPGQPALVRVAAWFVSKNPGPFGQ